jgi:hypothetical protein
LFEKGGLEIAGREGFTGWTMTHFDNMASKEEPGRRLGRLPLVVLVTVSLLFSLLHCATCELAFANADSATVVMSIDQNSTPDTPEHLLPCHHCLSHVTAQLVNASTDLADLIPLAPSYLREQFRASPSGLPPFKPPRA